MPTTTLNIRPRDLANFFKVENFNVSFLRMIMCLHDFLRAPDLSLTRS